MGILLIMQKHSGRVPFKPVQSSYNDPISFPLYQITANNFQSRKILLGNWNSFHMSSGISLFLKTVGRVSPQPYWKTVKLGLVGWRCTI